MKPRSLPFRLLLIVAFLGAFAGTAGLTLWAAEGKTERKAKSTERKMTSRTPAELKPEERRPPLQLNVDRKPIDRNAPDRVSYAPVIKRTAASVVYVYTTRTVRGRDLSPFFNDPTLRRFFDLPGAPRDGRVPDRQQRGLGSGIVITADGYILTNHHVVDGADDVRVSIGESNRRYEAKVVGRDELSDIAVLKIEASGLVPAVFGDSDQLEVGDVVLAIGNPFGVGQSVSRGIVSALSRGIGIGPFEDFIQTDAAINMGNSGGALIDTEGRVVGINTAILSRTGGFAGLGFAIPINFARSVAEQIVNTGRVERGMLGVLPQDLTEDLTSAFGSERGTIVAEVNPGTPAEQAGLKPGDVITKINDVEIRDGRHLRLIVSQMPPDADVKVEYLRDKKPQTVTVKLARRTEQIAGVNGAAPTEDVGVLNGVTVGDITPQMRRQLRIPERVTGAIITNIDPDSPSARQGLREGDIILQLDRHPVENAEEAVRLSEEISGPRVMVRIFRQGQTQFLVIDESRK
jgi:serine protease Do